MFQSEISILTAPSSDYSFTFENDCGVVPINITKRDNTDNLNLLTVVAQVAPP